MLKILSIFLIFTVIIPLKGNDSDKLKKIGETFCKDKKLVDCRIKVNLEKYSYKSIKEEFCSLKDNKINGVKILNASKKKLKSFLPSFCKKKFKNRYFYKTIIHNKKSQNNYKKFNELKEYFFINYYLIIDVNKLKIEYVFEDFFWEEEQSILHILSSIKNIPFFIFIIFIDEGRELNKRNRNNLTPFLKILKNSNLTLDNLKYLVKIMDNKIFTEQYFIYYLNNNFKKDKKIISYLNYLTLYGNIITSYYPFFFDYIRVQMERYKYSKITFLISYIKGIIFHLFYDDYNSLNNYYYLKVLNDYYITLLKIIYYVPLNPNL